nr:hypothetical protein [Pedobacter panaciterrae]
MNKTFIFLLITSIAHFGYSQNLDSITPSGSIVKMQKSQNDILKIAVIKVLGKHMDFDLLKDLPKNYVHVISASIVIDSGGRIDMVYFPERMSDDLKKIIKPGAELISKLKKIQIKFTEFRGKIAVFPILYKRIEDTSLDYKSSFLNDFENLWPVFDYKDQKKQIVLLSPYLNGFGYIVN